MGKQARPCDVSCACATFYLISSLHVRGARGGELQGRAGKTGYEAGLPERPALPVPASPKGIDAGAEPEPRIDNDLPASGESTRWLPS